MSPPRADRWARLDRLSPEGCCSFRRDMSASETAHLGTCFWSLASSVNASAAAATDATVSMLVRVSRHCAEPLENLRQVGVTVAERAAARAVVNLKNGSRGGRSPADVETLSAAHVDELTP